MSYGHAPRPQASQATEQQLIACIDESLALHIHDNARFLAERLIAESPTEVLTCIPTRTSCEGSHHHVYDSTLQFNDIAPIHAA